MSESATREYVLRMRSRYGAMRRKKAKGRILDDFCATTGLSRKHAIKLLRGTKEPRKRRGRKAKYGKETAEALKRIWLAVDQPCSKLMEPVMGCYVKSYERLHGPFPSPVREHLLSMSASSMDRLLQSARVKHPRRCHGPRGISAVKREVPVRTGEWDVNEPGWMEADTVAHCGGNMAGNFVWSLTVTDILTQWTEVRAMWNRGAAGCLERVEEAVQSLPFVIRGVDVDNGPEFLNWHLYHYCRQAQPAISFTRSRPYQKNDQAHVEQKNGTHVRRLLGHDRIEDSACVEDLNEVLALWSLWKNLYSPVRRLISKTRVGHRYTKKYDKAKTPAQRALASESMGPDQKAYIQKLIDST